MSLQYRSDTGALLKLETGELMRECCCSSVTCNNCSPRLLENYIVTISGLNGVWAYANGVWTLPHYGGYSACQWKLDFTDPAREILLWWYENYSQWFVYVDYRHLCRFIFTTGVDVDPCNPCVAYPDTGCSDFDCEGNCALQEDPAIIVSEP